MTVMQDVVTETCDLRISVLRAGAPRLYLSHEMTHLKPHLRQAKHMSPFLLCLAFE
jgi:hypothetical protein